jgi:hypothetical protein
VLVVLAVLSACGGGAPTSPGSPAAATPSPAPVGSPDPDGWEVLAGSPASPANSRHDDLAFLDEQTGWLVNIRGEVHATRDGGATWDLLARMPDVGLRCVGFASPTRGWAGNLNFTMSPRPDVALWETLDGGRTWANVSTRITGPPVAGLCGMRVLTPNVVVAVGRWRGPPVFVKTTDGGRSWTSRSLAPLASGLVDLHFFNEQDGLAVGALGDGPSEAEQHAARTVVLATADGGETWQTRYMSTDPGQRAWKIHFVDDRVGYVTIEGSSPEGVVLKTTDGGSTWRPLVVSPGLSFQGVAFIDAQRGWVASGETLYATTDGGASWRPLFFGRFINRMRVVSDAVAYASGDHAYRWRR